MDTLPILGWSLLGLSVCASTVILVFVFWTMIGRVRLRIGGWRVK
jgi:hypothetical protein